MDRLERKISAQQTITLMNRDSYQAKGSLIDNIPSIKVNHDKKTKISVNNENAINRVFIEAQKYHVGILNFASATHAGGGFERGANAQEEAICRVSYLYKSLIKFNRYYQENRENKNRYLYSSKLIYSKSVKFIKNVRNGKEYLTKPVFCDVVTIAAPNKSANKRNYQKVTEREYTVDLITKLTNVLRVFAINHCDSIILGAFGCGVFKNDPVKVAKIFNLLLASNEFKNIFSHVTFSIFGKGPNLKAFQEEFKV